MTRATNPQQPYGNFAMLKIVLASLALGFATNAVIKALMTGQLALAAMPVACALVIVAMLYGCFESLTLRVKQDDEERLSFKLRLR
jgi:hypothetical protein